MGGRQTDDEGQTDEADRRRVIGEERERERERRILNGGKSEGEGRRVSGRISSAEPPSRGPWCKESFIYDVRSEGGRGGVKKCSKFADTWTERARGIKIPKSCGRHIWKPPKDETPHTRTYSFGTHFTSGVGKNEMFVPDKWEPSSCLHVVSVIRPYLICWASLLAWRALRSPLE